MSGIAIFGIIVLSVFAVFLVVIDDHGPIL